MEQLLGESNSEYNSRKEFYDFLVEEKINDADKISKMWANIKYRECRYSSKLYNFIMKLDRKMNKNKDST